MIGVIRVAWEVLEWSASIWIWADFFSLIFMFRRDAYKRLRNICGAVKPLAWPGALLTVANLLADPWGTWDNIPLFFRLLMALLWLHIAYRIYRSHDDDYWKKKRKKLAAKVKQIAGKLVVVPIPAPVST